MEFDRWKDYLQLGLLVQRMARIWGRHSWQPDEEDASLPAKEVPNETGNATPQPLLPRKLIYVPMLYCPTAGDTSLLNHKMDNGMGNYTPKQLAPRNPFLIPATNIPVEMDNTLQIQQLAAEMGQYLPIPQLAGSLNNHPARESQAEKGISLPVQERANETGTSIPPSASSHFSNASPHGEDSNGGDNPDLQCGVCPEEQNATGKFCKFCKHNGESSRVYSTHTLRNSNGIIICPVLRKYTCPLCGATGALSHTRKYCPFNDDKSCLYNKSGRNSAGHLVRR
ncbi:protein nanos isoform X1 [Xenopus tropicalis]|uniref:Protein nanos n=1 Tax=Xenopus tropicalis TaxID=8364 RepID=A0A803JW51_XENTR|nr:protein nanos isoform X1 [Xenopus tropicalis]